MGSGYSVGGSNSGVIPQAMKMLFEMVDSRQNKTEFQIRVSYIEVRFSFQPQKECRPMGKLLIHLTAFN